MYYILLINLNDIKTEKLVRSKVGFKYTSSFECIQVTVKSVLNLNSIINSILNTK